MTGSIGNGSVETAPDSGSTFQFKVLDKLPAMKEEETGGTAHGLQR